MRITGKITSLLRQKKYKALFSTGLVYLNFIRIKIWFGITGKDWHPDLKKTNKDWIIYTYLKQKYKRFLKNYPAHSNEEHKYSNIIWWCWLQGEENAPALSKKCLESLRLHIPDKEIKIITSDNMYDYVDFPDYIKEKYAHGKISHAHFSDLLRLQLLIKYGGTWIDATVFCTARPDYIFNIPLFVFKTKEKNDPATTAQNWFMSAERNNPILTLTRDLLFEYWKTHGNAIHYFIFYFFMTLAAEKYPKEWEAVPWFPDLPPHILQRELNKPYSEARWKQICRMSDIHKLSYKIDLSEEKNTFYHHIMGV